MLGESVAAKFSVGLSSSMISGAITNVIGESVINNNIKSSKDVVSSIVTGVAGGTLGYGTSYVGGFLGKKALFNNMTRTEQRNFMRENFGIRSNISDYINSYSNNNFINNYYQNNSWIIGGVSGFISNYGEDKASIYLPSKKQDLSSLLSSYEFRPLLPSYNYKPYFPY